MIIIEITVKSAVLRALPRNSYEGGCKIFKYFNSAVNMLENLKDQIHSLRWLKTEAAPAVTNQTTKMGQFLQLPILEEGGRSASPTAYRM